MSTFGTKSKRSNLDIFKRLSKPFPDGVVHFKIGDAWIDERANQPKASILSYIDARNVQDRLDEVMTPSGWATDTKAVDGGFLYGLGLKFEDGWVWKWDGAPQTEEEGFKGGISRALCRAASAWGIGRYLYELGREYAEFVSPQTKGASPVEIDGQIFYWIKQQASSRVVTIVPSQSSPFIPTPLIKPVITPLAASQSDDPDLFRIPFRRGPCATKRFSELTPDLHQSLIGFMYMGDPKPLTLKVRRVYEAWCIKNGRPVPTNYPKQA